MAGFGTWFRRRVVRADLEDTEMVASTGYGTVSLQEYLEDGSWGRRYWLVWSVLLLLLFVALPGFLVLGLWERADLDRGDPFRIGVGVLVTVASWWFAMIWQSSVRAMLRTRGEPRRSVDDEDDEDDEHDEHD